ncbi:leader peptidase (prepilin peptidase)/N-methyltransferase [Diaminobutyricimonas aerilata]|uniref:Prepilin leader peptidase/N-methyltransferase n=1 Tax=Diaminobutyricimonas aerilata TaxID=1162967 RepID=A0A2M9CMV8_9MICO|nr:A24 family peptidase [Diaminobutyricimonas aerilata]PJJ73246.1 leader peptidase (prepilin peptidase)/N-methyltransferase [Diaminobutyricimonas aerilata]
MIVAAVALGIFGSLIGSFLNVVVYRVPRKLSVVHPPSACPNCGTPIRARDNVPVLSWLALRGRCRDCATPISARYPLVELATGLAFVPVTLVFGPSVLEAGGWAPTVAAVLVLAAYLFFMAVSIALTLIDLDTHTLPNRIVLPTIAVLVVLFTASALLTGDLARLATAALGALILFAFYLVLAIASGGGMGMGDVKLAAAIGLALGWLGWPALIVGSLSAFLVGGVVSLVLLASKRVGRRSGIPFGPWMLIGAWLAILLGDRIWSSYLGLFGVS